jgi:hypothetical protein
MTVFNDLLILAIAVLLIFWLRNEWVKRADRQDKELLDLEERVAALEQENRLIDKLQADVMNLKAKAFMGVKK